MILKQNSPVVGGAPGYEFHTLQGVTTVPISESAVPNNGKVGNKFLCPHSFCFASCYLPPCRRPGMGDIATPPVCPSVTFSFHTVTRKRIDVFSRNFPGTCTMLWGCAM